MLRYAHGRVKSSTQKVIFVSMVVGFFFLLRSCEHILSSVASSVRRKAGNPIDDPWPQLRFCDINFYDHKGVLINPNDLADRDIDVDSVSIFIKSSKTGWAGHRHHYKNVGDFLCVVKILHNFVVKSLEDGRDLNSPLFQLKKSGTLVPMSYKDLLHGMRSILSGSRLLVVPRLSNV